MSARFLLKLLLFSVALISLFRFAEGADNFGVRGLNFTGTNLETACQMVEDAEIGWHRGDVLWRGIVDNGGNYDWGSLDQQIESILRHEISIILTLRSVHELFAPGSGQIDLGYDIVWKSTPPAPEYIENYKDFVRQIVERYDGDGVSDAPFVSETKNIKYWQIENEPGKKPDEGSVFWNGTAGGSKEVKVLLPWDSVLITHVITEPGVVEPVTEIKSTQDRVLQITLDSSPVFVEKYLEVGNSIY